MGFIPGVRSSKGVPLTSQTEWKLTAGDGTDFGAVSSTVYRAFLEGKIDSYKPVNPAEQKIINDFRNYNGYEIKNPLTGNTIDKVTWDAVQALNKNNLDGYTPKNNAEKKVFNTLKTLPLYDLTSADGVKHGKVSYETLKDITENGAQNYTPKSAEEQQIINSYKTNAFKITNIPLKVKLDGKDEENFGNVSYNALMAIENGTLDSYTPQNDGEKKAIEKLNKYMEEYAKEQREPEGFWSGLLSTLGYTLEKLGAGAVDTVADAGDFILGGLATAGQAVTWGSWNEWLKNEADYRFSAETLGDAWNENIESRYRVPDWYREYGGTTAFGAGAMIPALVAEYYTAGASPLLDAQLANMSAMRAATTTSKTAKALNTIKNSIKTSDIVFGIGAAGSATKEGYAMTGDAGKALNYGILNGLGEMATEKLFGGFAGLGKNADELIDVHKYASKIPQIGKRASTKYGAKVLDIALEGVEEMIMTDLSPWMQKASGVNPNAESATWKERGESFFQGVLLSGFMNASTYTFGKAIDLKDRVKTIYNLNKDARELNGTLPSGVAKFEPLKYTANKRQIEERNSEINRIDGINTINGATEAINTLLKDDVPKLKLLKYDATTEEITQRQKAIAYFGEGYADLLVDELVKNNPEKFENIETTSTEESPVVNDPVVTEQRNIFTGELDEIASTEMPTVSVGDTFIDTSTNNILKVVGRDESNTTIEITKPSGEKETKTHPNHGADTLAVNDKYKKVETSTTTPADNVAVAENTTTTPKVNVGDVYKHKENGTTYTIVSRDDKNTTYTVK